MRMDKHVDPFDNFYLYACGSWLKNHEIPSDKSSIGTFYKLHDKTQVLLRKIAEDSNTQKGVNRRVVNDMYSSFMDYRTRNKLGFEPVKGMLSEIDTINSKKELVKHLGIARLHGIETFFGLDVEEDAKDSSVYALCAWQGGIGLPDRDYYLAKEFAGIRDKYIKYICGMFDLYGHLDGKSADFATAVFTLEKELAHASKPNSELTDPVKNYNLMKSSELERRYRNIGFGKLCANIGAKHVDSIVIGQPEFFDCVDKLIAQSSLSEIKAYLQWCILNGFSGSLGKDPDDRRFDFYGKSVIGNKKMKPKWKRAVGFVQSAAGEALGEIYAANYLSKRDIEKAKLLVEDIRHSLMDRIKALDWMGDKTKSRAIEKLEAMRAYVGRPKRFREYARLETDSKTLADNLINVCRFELDRDVGRIGKKVDREEWKMDVYEVNAIYDPSNNSITIPAGILKPPFFDANADDAVNYAGIGSIIGHEITHGFDSSGSKFDKEGNMVEWWSKRDRKMFEMRCKEIERVYGSMYVLPGLKLNGKLTETENIADLGGIRIAYDALQRSIRRNGGNRIIDGFTQEQIFFISYAQLWRGKNREGLKRMYALADTHSPQEIRGLIPVVTHPSFRNAFAGLSRIGTIKQPHKEISIW